MRTRESHTSAFTALIRPLLIGTAVGVVVSVLVLMLMALLVQSVDVPRAAVLPLAMSAGAVGAFMGGLTTALTAGRRGLMMGALCGLVLFFLILLAGFVRFTGVSGTTAVLKAVVLVVAGGIGGLLGVLRRKR